jgi:hypothetical protein
MTMILCHLPPQEPALSMIPGLTAALWRTIDRHGRVTTSASSVAPTAEGAETVAGRLLLALAYAAHAGHGVWDRDRWLSAFRYYRHRFRYAGGWTLGSVLLPAFSIGAQAAADEEVAASAHEVAAEVLLHQSRRTGEFFADRADVAPGARTGLYLEGLGSVTDLAVMQGKGALVRTYRCAVEAGLRFLDGFTIQGPDEAVLPNPSRALGGVRAGRGCSRVDIVGMAHSLAAAEWVLPLIRTGPAKSGQ